MILDIYYGQFERQSRISVTDWAARTKSRLALAGLLGQLSVCRVDKADFINFCNLYLSIKYSKSLSQIVV